MKRNILLTISLFLSIVGIIALFFLKPDVSPQSLQLTGVVNYYNTKEKVTFINFVPDDLMVVSFDDFNLEPGKHTLTGRLQQYEGKVEFVVDSYD